ncbi:hypothetical protein [Halopenitus persicus]|uniref:DUF7978 domain-containing protein n=1 Tax=Halopenitus persicus TaxID=1048396 RepID=A0A1H3FER1_9EURY|nr:hypothetical protein [Halopenitus persicus]QHS16620.1 transporter [haloarchaeon 3A1-DGR]SDX89583.1 hypothetical protein SAMN05216564_10224 [Halopenitus persicus]
MSDETLTDRLPLVPGAVAGAGAYLLGYLLTYLWQGSAVEEQLQGINVIADLLGGEPIAVWQGVGWLFYNAHFVRTRAEGVIGGTRSWNAIAAADDGTLTLLYLVPVLLLVAVGALLARVATAETPGDGAIAGTAAVVGYLPPAVVGAVVFTYDGSVAPDLVTAVLLAGIAYPVVLGAIGGAVGGVAGGK